MEAPGFSDRTPEDLKVIIDQLIEDEIKLTPMTQASIDYYRRYASQIFDIPGHNEEITLFDEDQMQKYIDGNFMGVFVPRRNVSELMFKIFETAVIYRFGETLSESILNRLTNWTYSEP